MSSEATVSSLFYLYLIDIFSIWYALWFVSRSYMELKKIDLYIYLETRVAVGRGERQ